MALVWIAQKRSADKNRRLQQALFFPDCHLHFHREKIRLLRRAFGFYVLIAKSNYYAFGASGGLVIWFFGRLSNMVACGGLSILMEGAYLMHSALAGPIVFKHSSEALGQAPRASGHAR